MTYPEVQEEPAAGTSLAAYEAAFAAAFLAALTAWLASVATAVLAGFTKFGIAPNVDALFSKSGDWSRAVDKLIPDLEDMARLGWLQGNQDLGTRIPFDPGNQFVQEQLARTRNLLVRISDEVYKDIVNALNTAVRQGKDVVGQASAVRAVLDGSGSENWAARARTVAVTEVNRAWNFGVIAHGLTVTQTMRVMVLKMWDSKDDSRVRAAHEQADGQTVLISQPFIVGFEALMAPGDPSGSPWNVINCVPGSTPIRAYGIQKAARYWHEGKLIKISLRSGDEISVSSNHPMLAERGWILASQLHEGDKLVGTRELDSALVVDPDVKTRPSKMEEIFDALLESGISERVIGLPVDFHGDGPHGDIEIVSVDRELSFGVESSIEEDFEHLCLSFADAPDASGGPLNQLLMGSRNTPDGIVSFSDLVCASASIHATPFQEFGISSTPDDDATINHSVGKCGATDIRTSCETLHRLASHVALDEIVEIRDEEFSGHLYTLQTSSGVFISASTVSHNCRCRARLRKG